MPADDFIGKSAEQAGKELAAAQKEELKAVIEGVHNQANQPTAEQMKVLSHADTDLHVVNKAQALFAKEQIDITPEMLEAAEVSAKVQPATAAKKVEPTTPQEEPTPSREAPRLGGGENE